MSMERASVNDHYGFYQTPAKIIQQQNKDNMSSQDDDLMVSYDTALRDQTET